MKNISVFQAVLLAVFGALALGGIVVFSTYSGSSKNKVTIGNVVIWGVLPNTEMRTALAEISKQNQDFKSVTYVEKKQSEFEADLSKAIATGKAPDLVLISQDNIIPLTNEIRPIPYASLPKRNFLNAFADISSIYLGPNGAYGIPIAIDPMMLYYNRRLLSSAGIVSPPKTWDALSGLVPRVVKLTKSQNVSRALIAFGSYNNVNNAYGVLSTLFLQAGVPLVTRNSKGVYLTSFGINGAETDNITSPGVSVVRFYTEFADPTKVSYTWNSTLPKSRQEFLAGNLALYLGYASEARFISEANPNLSFDVSVMPQLAVAPTKTVFARVYAFAIPRGSSNPSGALLAASKMSSLTNEKIISDKLGLAPSLRSLLAITPKNPITSIVYTSAIMSRAWLAPSINVTNKIFSRMIKEVITGSSSIAQSLTKTKQSFIVTLP